jgi:uncharacterized protein (DUF4415 family)
MSARFRRKSHTDYGAVEQYAQTGLSRCQNLWSHGTHTVRPIFWSGTMIERIAKSANGAESAMRAQKAHSPTTVKSAKSAKKRKKRKKRTRRPRAVWLTIDADCARHVPLTGSHWQHSVSDPTFQHTKPLPVPLYTAAFTSISFIVPSRVSKYCCSFHRCRHGLLHTCAFVACCCPSPERCSQRSGTD